MKQLDNLRCPYCDELAKLVTGKVIYPHRRDLWDKKLWHCGPCKAWVGCHRDSDKPFGRLANAELRKLKTATHSAFDPIWLDGDKRQRRQRRVKAYTWLAEKMGIDADECHIGMFDEGMCQQAIKICKERNE